MGRERDRRPGRPVARRGSGRAPGCERGRVERWLEVDPGFDSRSWSLAGHSRAWRRDGPRTGRLGARLHGPGNRDREPGHGHALDAQRAEAALPRLEWHLRRPQLQLVGRDPLRRRLVRAEPARTVRRQRPRQPHDRNLDRRRRLRESDRRRSRSEVDRLPQHGPGRGYSGHVHGVLRVLHRPVGSRPSESQPGASAARDQQQLAVPAEPGLRAGHAAGGRRERTGRRDLRRGFCRRRRPQLQHDLRSAGDLRGRVLNRRCVQRRLSCALQRSRPSHDRRLRPDQARHRGARGQRPLVGQ